jgi:hypothetical protein
MITEDFIVGRYLIAILVAISVCAAPTAAVELSSNGRIILETASVFDEGRLPLAEKDLHLDATLRMGGRRLERPIARPEEILAGRSSSLSTGRRKRTIISVLCSAVLPGLGELYLYRETRDNGILARVPLFMAVEGYLWYGYAHNYSKGKDLKQDYMDYADEHWSLERFLEQHPCCDGIDGCDDWQQYNDYCSEQGTYFFLYTPLEMDEEEYYENLGKYDAFMFGWDDWQSIDESWTPHRTYYWSLRIESDKYLLRADRHLMLLIVNRVVSMIDAGLLAYRMGEDGSEAEGWSIELKPGREAPIVNLCYRF